MQKLKPKIDRNALSLNPAQMTMLSFVALSFLGTFLLMLPIANTNGEWRDFISAFFMSVSSVCVTGLAVVDLGTDFSLLGQIITLALIQIGGLSYMTFTTIFLYMAGKKLSFSETKIFDMSNNSEQKINFADFVIKIGLLTFVIEFIGFLTLVPGSLEKLGINLLDFSNPEYFKALFQALFHSISAFCNAGLSLYQGSLEGFRSNYWFLWIFSLLPILGGLGYTTLSEVQAFIMDKKANKRLEYLSLHTKVSLIVTFSLLFIGIFIQFVLIPNSAGIFEFFI